MAIHEPPHYTLVQLLDDDYFISSVKKPTLESDIFWKDAIKKGYLKEDTYNTAKTFILSVQPDKLSKDQKDVLWGKIRERQAQKQKRRPALWIIAPSVAACFLVLIYLSINHYFKSHHPGEELLVLLEKPDITTDHIQLIFSDDMPLAIKDKNAHIQYTEEGEILVNSDILGKEQNNSARSEKKETERYNQLIIPKGQQSSLLLSDGTKIWINAGTRLIYPPLFSQKERTIHVEGEIFLDVYPDQKRPFIVKTKEFDIQVTGTSFNISSYDNVIEQAVVLVEGAVRIKTRDREEEITLSPNQKFSYSEGKYNIETVDTSAYTAWKNGFYQYKGERISNVIRKLSFYYNINIYCDEEVAGITCSGKLDLKQDIEKVLGILCKGAVPMTFYEEENSYYIVQSE